MAEREGGARWQSREISTGVRGCRSSVKSTQGGSWKRERREEVWCEMKQRDLGVGNEK